LSLPPTTIPSLTTNDDDDGSKPPGISTEITIVAIPNPLPIVNVSSSQPVSPTATCDYTFPFSYKERKTAKTRLNEISRLQEEMDDFVNNRNNKSKQWGNPYYGSRQSRTWIRFLLVVRCSLGI
jgi:hypothetical protein